MDAVAAQHPVRAGFVLLDAAQAGIFSAAAVLIVHFGCDLAAGDPLRTPAILHALVAESQAVGGQAAGASQHFAGVDAARYSAALVMLCWAVGLAVSFLISLSDAYPKLWYAAVAVMGVFFSSVIYLAWAIQIPGLPRLNLPLGALAGSSAMLGFLALRHPGFRKHFDRVQLTSVGAHDLADAYERECQTRARYQLASETFAGAPAFTAAAKAEDHHIATLVGLFDSFDLDAPEAPPEPELRRPLSLEQAYREGIAQERAMAKMYDGFLLAVEERKLWEAFESLRWSSEGEILASFQQALDELHSH